MWVGIVMLCFSAAGEMRCGANLIQAFHKSELICNGVVLDEATKAHRIISSQGGEVVWLDMQCIDTKIGDAL